MDRAFDYESKGCKFESCRGHMQQMLALYRIVGFNEAYNVWNVEVTTDKPRVVGVPRNGCPTEEDAIAYLVKHYGW
jgi:hypothetical protein